MDVLLSDISCCSNQTSGIFGGVNHAYFVPKSRAVEAMNWWRQHKQELYFMMHVNTGCEYKDHSEWFAASLQLGDD